MNVLKMIRGKSLNEVKFLFFLLYLIILLYKSKIDNYVKQIVSFLDE